MTRCLLDQAIAYACARLPPDEDARSLPEPMLDDINAFQVRFGTDAAHGRHFLVTVENSSGRRSAICYFGIPGKRLRRVRR